MDLWFSSAKMPLERELQQLVERMNNSNPATDYFICDIEYTNSVCNELRADLIALNWPSTAADRKRPDCGKLAIIEMKHGDGALTGESGLVSHIRQLENAAVDFVRFANEMSDVFNQRVELGLINCHTYGDKQPKLVSMKTDKKAMVDYIILLSDHDPASSILLRELNELRDARPSSFNVKVALATYTGYGLYEENILTLDDFLKRFGKQALSSTKEGVKA